MSDDRRRDREIIVEGACEHNLTGIDVAIPRGTLTVVTGVSGSGKSSLAFDTIGREAQRRYLETFPAYARSFLGSLRRPAARRLDGLSPAIVLDQRPTTSSPRSTVGTLTEVWDLLRLLYARVGMAPPGVTLSRSLFSFNTPEGACPRCQGLGLEDRLDPELLVGDAASSLREGALRVTTPTGYLMYSQVTLAVLDQVLHAHGGSIDTPWQDLTDEQRHVVLYGSERLKVPFGKHPLENRLKWKGITARPREEGFYKGLLPVMETILGGKRNPSILRFVRTQPCAACAGTRLKPEVRAVLWHDQPITALGGMSAAELDLWLQAAVLTSAEAPVVTPVRAALGERLKLLGELGLGYLTSDRPAATLSAGEAQRVRLVTQALGSLRGLLYVLDEPSVGLHPRDTERLLGVLRRLRDVGNTVLVVEHEEVAIRGADHLVDLGPGAGSDGGRLLWSGSVAGRLAEGAGDSPTREWLRSPPPALGRARRPGQSDLQLAGLVRNNLQGIDVTLRRGALNVITGVSGAGKTSLLVELLGRAEAGAIDPAFARILEVDQTPIGRTPRSNPATYTGVSDLIRDLYAATPEARAAGLGKGHFSFNVAGGRCAICEGAGVIDVGMRFLGTVEVSCEACGGRRFSSEVLAVRVGGASIAEVLAMRVDEALRHFAEQPRILRTLRTLHELGLGYVALGQPASTLSGGEAQRIKLATELQRPAGRGALVALDEPTRGLHAADVVVLLGALNALVDAGATVVVVEHDGQVIAAADWVVDLGPESGHGGGRVVAMGTPEVIAACAASHTGTWLGRSPGSGAAAHAPAGKEYSRPASAPAVSGSIALRGVRTHNLKGVDVEIPFPGLTVVTGPSGSGKSSLALDTLAAEAHNRFSDCVSAWARRFLPRHGAADLEEARGLTAVVSLAQRPSRRNPRSTVGSATEVADLLRLMFARAGVRPCPVCAGPFEGASGACGHHLDTMPLASSFSPASESGACRRCRGLGFVTLCDPERLVTDPTRSLGEGALDGSKIGAFFGERDGQHVATLRAAGRQLGIDFERPWLELDARAREVAMRGAGELTLEVEWSYRRGARSGVHRFRSAWLGFAGLVEQEYERVHEDDRALPIEPLLVERVCPDCHGERLGVEARGVRFGDRRLPELTAMPANELLAFLEALPSSASSPRALTVTADARAESAERLRRLCDAGLGYLSLDRETASLSAGEGQRVRLASALTGGLVGIAYVLDEPTAGLHPRDTTRLLALLHELARAGNAVVVVEHDADVIAAADHVIELGPGPGEAGGNVVARGTPAALAADAGSVTGDLLRARAAAADEDGPWARGREAGREGAPRGAHLTLAGATLHNLRDLTVEFPARALTVVSGVSGCGKSTLVFDLLARSLGRHLRGLGPEAGVRALVCHAPVTAVVAAERQQAVTAEGSTLASFAGLWDRIRSLFAKTHEARARGLSARHFSTAAAGGRCETCHGLGVVTVAMDFLPDVVVDCEACGGARFGAEVLAVRLRGRSVADLLGTTVEGATTIFADDAQLSGALTAIGDVGLGYLRLGQATSSLSGGELQRLRLAPLLATGSAEGAVVVLDEPTTGLHHRDVRVLLAALRRLVARGATVVVVEHNLDVVAAADHVIDLGPEGGPGGGRIVAAGAPAVIAACLESHTGRALCGRFGGLERP